MTLSIKAPSIKTFRIIINIIRHSIIVEDCYAECHLYSASILVSVTYKPFKLSVVMLSVVMLSVVMLSVVMLSVVALY